eukprot:Sspe_Gene.20904::Locus_7726_Transcript_1_1_Confidence_1.000_Length_873::g.20904::m.20904/K01363/CTSB; cathepsin B
MCGRQRGHPHYYRLPEKKVEALRADQLPTDFDARTQWPKCSDPPRCGTSRRAGRAGRSGRTEAFEDRQCVATGEDVEMSVEDTASCCSGFECGLSMGCNGGQPSAALSWMARTGVVTGGDYGDKGSCRPYTLAPCALPRPRDEEVPGGPVERVPDPEVLQSSARATTPSRTTTTSTRGSAPTPCRARSPLMTELMTKGPLAAAFTVYLAFPTY